MELTLIPIAAILLLLTGLGAPSRLAAAGRASSAASLRLWLLRERPQRTIRLATRSPRSASAGTVGLGQRTARLQALAKLAQGARLAAHRLDRTLFRTRFGVVTCAYRSAAPPAATVCSRPTAA